MRPKSHSSGLGEHPSFKAILRGDELTLHHRADVGIAVDSGVGCRWQ
jgi:hypothetical protein